MIRFRWPWYFTKTLERIEGEIYGLRPPIALVYLNCPNGDTFRGEYPIEKLWKCGILCEVGEHFYVITEDVGDDLVRVRFEKA